MTLSVALALAFCATPAERFDSMLAQGVEARRKLIEEQGREFSPDAGTVTPQRPEAMRTAETINLLETADEKRDRIAYKSVAAPAPSLNQMQTATAIAAATAAIDTSLEGVEAGLSVSPFLVAGKFDWVVQPSLTLAALENGGARFGLGFASRFGEEPIGPRDLGLTACVPSAEKLTPAFEKYRLAYLTVCEAVALPAVSAGIDANLLAEVGQACGTGDGEELPFVRAMSVLAVTAKDLGKLGAPVFKTTEDLERRQKVAQAGAALEKLDLPTVDDCWTDEDVANASAAAAANARTLNVGLSANVDLLPIQWGFAGDSTLSRGEYRAWEVRTELRWAQHGYELGASLGFSRSREELGKPLYNSLAAQVRVSMILASLTVDSVRGEGGALRVVDGELPPHLVLGLVVSTKAALTRPETQLTPLNEFEVAPYVEAHFGEKLAVRLGIPVRARVVTRAAVSEADATDTRPAGPEVRDLQWSIPPTITTVLKID